MPSLYKVLAQIVPTLGVVTDAYTCPVGMNVLVARIMVCNQGAAAGVFDVMVAPLGVADATPSPTRIFFNNPLGIAETVAVALGCGLQATDKIRVYSSVAGVSFNIFGVELT